MINKEALDQFQQLLRQLKFPEPRARTFLEVIDLHRIEAVSSRLLAFLFDSQGEHGLGNLPLVALMKVLKRTEITAPHSLTVKQEVTCRQQRGKKIGRVDLVVELRDDHLLVIENKIHHHLHNPFSLYIKHFTKHYPDHKRQFVLMGLNEPDTVPNGYVFVSHREYGEALRALLEESNDESVSTSYYRTFILDYLGAMDTMGNKKLNAQQELVVNFCQQNFELLDKLENESDNIRHAMRTRLTATLSAMENEVFDAENFYDIDYGTWALHGEFVAAEYIRLPTATHKVGLYAHWSLKYVYVTLEMYTRNREYEVDQDEVINLLNQQGVTVIQDDEIEETVIYRESALGMTPERFAKDLDALYEKLTGNR